MKGCANGLKEGGLESELQEQAATLVAGVVGVAVVVEVRVGVGIAVVVVVWVAVVVVVWVEMVVGVRVVVGVAVKMKHRQRITSLFADRLPIVSRFAPPRPAHQPAVATDHEHGYRVRAESLGALRNYDGGKNAFSLGPHHNMWSRREALALQNGREVGHLEIFRRKVDMRIEILAAALYAEGYSVADMAAKSEQVFGVKLSETPIWQCIRRAFGEGYRALSRKQKQEFVKKAKRALQDGDGDEVRA